MQYLEAFLIALVLAFIIRFFFVSAYRVTSEHMEPNLRVGDFVIASKWSTGWKVPFTENEIWKSVWPKRGDVVIFRCPKGEGRACVKRLVGLPGDRLEIVEGRLLVNGETGKYDSFAEENQPNLLVERVYGDSRNILATVGKSELEKIDRFGPAVVPPGEFFVLSDNRIDGIDSREWGSLPKSSLIGVAGLVWLSLDWRKPIFGGFLPSVRSKRLFKSVD